MKRVGTIFFLAFTLVFLAGAQTKISMPPARVNFSELANASSPQKRKALKRRDRFKLRKIKGIKKDLRKNTNLKKYEIDRYSVMIQGLDSAELERFNGSLSGVIESQDTQLSKNKELSQARKLHRDRKKWKAYKKSLKQGKFSKDSLTYDSLKFPGWNKPSFDSLNTSFKIPDSLSFANMDSLGLALPDIPIDSGFQVDANEVEAFLESFAKQRVEQQDLLLPVDNTPTTQVKNFIPELEKFNYKKPEIPQEKLSAALLQQQKERKKEELKRSFLDTFKGSDQEKQKISWVDRWQIGGFMEYKPQTRLIELTPTLTYGLGKKFMIGAGYSTVIPLQKDNEIERQIAYRTFADYVFYRSFFLHVESEWKEQKTTETGTLKERNTYLGLGKTFSYKKLSTNVLWLYNLSAPNQIETRRFSVRFAINFNP